MGGGGGWGVVGAGAEGSFWRKGGGGRGSWVKSAYASFTPEYIYLALGLFFTCYTGECMPCPHSVSMALWAVDSFCNVLVTVISVRKITKSGLLFRLTPTLPAGLSESVSWPDWTAVKRVFFVWIFCLCGFFFVWLAEETDPAKIHFSGPIRKHVRYRVRKKNIKKKCVCLSHTCSLSDPHPFMQSDYAGFALDFRALALSRWRP